jgi:ribose-phosphate pyrophosphokinase
MQGFRIFSGTGNPALAASIARHLGVSPAAAAVERFPDGEVSVRLLEPVRRKDVFIVQPTSPPVDAHLLELLAFADASRRAAATRITAVVPYFGYARADKRHGRREAIMASVAAEMLQAVGVDHVVTVGARDRLSHEAVRQVLVTDTVAVTDTDWPPLQVISVAPLIAAAIGRFLAGRLDRGSDLRFSRIG